MDFNITIGQYLKGDSWIYRLDPRFKILSVIILMVVIFMMPTIYHIIATLGVLLLIVITARLPLIHILKSLKPIIFISLFSFVLQLIYSTEGTLLHTFNLTVTYWHIALTILIITFYIFTKKHVPFNLLYLIVILIGIFCLYAYVDFSNGFLHSYSFNIFDDGVNKGVFFVVRLFCIIMLSTLLTLTTSTIDLNTGLERVLKPFKYIGLPVSEISLMISLTLRFIPTLLLETNKILKAQASRGVDFSEGSIIQKMKQIITLLIPMFVVSFKRADDLACAMESRGYVIGAERSNLNVLEYKIQDYIGFLLVFGALAYVITLQVIA
ncbi:MAG: energy-coupling factor transporter transmembrane component T [bacterium]